ncbi:MAG: hypothetical protein GC178_05475 [Flavobacteriales bacterium]|nr:hypothetical protein [Flavobacteriales bacterium]
MKVILDIKDSRSSFFMELLKSFDFVKVESTIEEKKKLKQVQDLKEAFEDVNAHLSGKKTPQSAKDLLDEL